MNACFLVILAMLRIFIGLFCTSIFLLFCFVVYEISKSIIYGRNNKWATLSKSQRLANAEIKTRINLKYMTGVWAMKLWSVLTAVDIPIIKIMTLARTNGVWILLKGMEG